MCSVMRGKARRVLHGVTGDNGLKHHVTTETPPKSHVTPYVTTVTPYVTPITLCNTISNPMYHHVTLP